MNGLGNKLNIKLLNKKNMAKGYQRRSRGGSFKIQDFGDLGLRSFKDQQEIIIEALKTQRARTAEYGKDYTRSLSNVAASEEENRKILQNLEDKAYQTRRNAITVRAAREVEALRAKADEYADQSKFWEDFSTTYSKEWGKLATGISDYADHRHAMDVIDDEDRKAAIQAFTTKGTIGGKEVGFEQLVDKASQNISTAADKEPDPTQSKKVRTQNLSNSNRLGAAEFANFERNIDSIYSGFQIRGKDVLLPSNMMELGKSHIKDYLEKIVKINPNSIHGRKIRNRWNNYLTTKVSEQVDIKEAQEDQETVRKRVQQFMTADPDDRTAALHDLLGHVRTMYLTDEKHGVIKPTVKRNKAQSWYLTASMIYEYAPNDHEIKRDWDKFQEFVFNHAGIPNDDGTPSDIKSFLIKNASRIESEFMPMFAKGFKDLTQMETLILTGKEVSLPLSEIRKEIDQLGVKDTIQDFSDDGWVEKQVRKAINSNNLDFRKKVFELVGYNFENHKNVDTWRELQRVSTHYTKESQLRTIYLLSRLNETEMPFYVNMDLGPTGKIAQDYHSAFTNSDKKWAEREVTNNLRSSGGVDPKPIVTSNAILTEQQLITYRGQEFTKLSQPDSKDYIENIDARMKKAQELTDIEFQKGIPKAGEQCGTGYFKACYAKTENVDWNNMTPGKYQLTWTGWDHVNEKNEVYTYTDITREDFLNEKVEGDDPKNWTSFIKQGKLVSHDTLTDIIMSINRGEWDGKLPENVTNFAALQGWDKRETLNRILDVLGFKIDVPVTTTEQINASGVNHMPDNGSFDYNKHKGSMALWNHYVNQLGKFPEIGPRLDKDFQTYTLTWDGKPVTLEEYNKELDKIKEQELYKEKIEKRKQKALELDLNLL